MSVVGVLGGGWLGSALAEKVSENGHKVKITSTTREKIDRFRQRGYEAQLLKISETEIEGKLEFFKEVDFLVITIPPGLRKNPQRNYVKLMEQIISNIQFFDIKKVLFTSSTSVYGFQENTITEESELLGNSTAAKQIIKVEQILSENKNFESCIVRLGGLIGSNRHPIFKLSGKKNLPNPLSPINFIHQKDAVAILLKIIQNWKGSQVYNAVTPFHPSRKDYYEHMAEIARVPPPTFENKGSIRGFISTKKVIVEFNCEFIVKNLLILN